MNISLSRRKYQKTITHFYRNLQEVAKKGCPAKKFSQLEFFFSKVLRPGWRQVFVQWHTKTAEHVHTGTVLFSLAQSETKKKAAAKEDIFYEYPLRSQL